MERIRDADTVLYFGRGFMPALEDAVEGDEAAVDLLAGASLRRASEDAEESRLDPHVWLDPDSLRRDRAEGGRRRSAHATQRMGSSPT